MTKQIDFAAVNGANADLIALDSFHNLTYHDGKHWFIKDISGDPYVASVVGLTGATVTAGANRTYNLTGYTFFSAIAKSFGNDIYLIASYKDTSENAIWVQFKSLDGGVNWETVYYTSSGDTKYPYVIDLFKIGSDVFYLQTYNAYTFTPDRICVNVRPFGEAGGWGMYYDVDGDYPAHTIGGYVLDGAYYFLVDNPTEDATYISKYKFLTDTVSYVESSGIAVADITNWSVFKQKYSKQGIHEILMMVDIYRNRKIGSATWTNITDVGSSTNGIVWGFDIDGNLIMNWNIWKDSILHIFRGGAIGRKIVYTGDAFVGWDDWFTDGVDILQVAPSIIATTRGQITNRVMNYPIASIQSSVQPFAKQWLDLFNDSDERIYQGCVVKDKNNQTEYIYTMISGIEEDFKVKITESYTSKTLHYIVKDIIDKYL